MKAAKGEAPTEAGKEASDIPFWEQKPLEAMNAAEWESLCDGCGRCCLVKLEDEDTGSFHFTAVACRLFDADRCTCRDYPHRTERVPDCVKLDVDAVRSFGWLPATCAYRLIAEGRGLYWWHPLVSGDPASVREAGISAHGKIAAFEDDVSPEELPGFIVTWPNRLPARARTRRSRAKR